MVPTLGEKLDYLPHWAEDKQQLFQRTTNVDLWHMLTLYVLFTNLFIYLFICMSLLAACMYVHYIHAWWRPEKGVGAPGIEVPNSCIPPCRSWEPNSGPVQEHLVLLTTEKSLRSMCLFVCLLP